MWCQPIPIPTHISNGLWGKNNKPPNSIDPNHEVITGTLNAKFKKVATQSLNSKQLSAGDDRRIHYGINKARDAIEAAGGKNECMDILDNDHKAAFDYIVHNWVFKVLKAKGLATEVIHTILNLYSNKLTVVVIYNVQAKQTVQVRYYSAIVSTLT